MQTNAWSVQGTVSSPPANHAVNLALKTRLQHPGRPGSRNRQERCTRAGVGCLVKYHAHRPSRRVLARPPSRDLTRHGCSV